MNVLLILLSSIAWADTPPPNNIKIKGATDGTLIGNVSDSQKVNITNTVPMTGTVSISNFPATQPVSALSLPLPSGASTASNQTLILTDLDDLVVAVGNPFQAGGSIGNSSFGISGTLPSFTSTQTFNVGTTSGKTSISLVRNAYASVNVTTSAYVQLIASTSGTINQLDVFDSSGQTLVLAVGGSGSEVDKFYIVPGGNGIVPLLIPTGSRVSIKAVSATANTGELDITFYQ